MSRRIRSAVYGSSAYRMSLLGSSPSELQYTPSDPWPSQGQRAEALFHGRYTFAGEEIRSPGTPPWRPEGGSEEWMTGLHSFEWLRALKQHGGTTAQRLARALIMDWIDVCGSWSPLVWRPDVLGRRLAALLLHAPFLDPDSADDFGKKFYQTLSLQARHLSRVVDQEVTGSKRLGAIRGMVYGTVCLSPTTRNISKLLSTLDSELRSQILPDGGHVERSPRQQCRVLADLTDIRDILSGTGVKAPPRLFESVDKMVPMLRCLRHGDGGLACFNGSTEGSSEIIDHVLKNSQANSGLISNAPHTGFQRISANKVTVIMDTGPTVPDGGNVYAGTLSFEMSVGKERLVVNCGPYRGGDSQWQSALRRSAAHSAITIGDRDSVVSVSKGKGLESKVTDVVREEQSGAIWVDAWHRGYEPIFGLRHRRRLYVDPDGMGLRGEDQIEPISNFTPEHLHERTIVVRFHLHPGVRASLIRNNNAVLLRLPSGVGWQFHAEGGRIDLHESIYFGCGGVRRRTEQVLLSSEVTEKVRVLKWAFQRITAPK